MWGTASLCSLILIYRAQEINIWQKNVRADELKQGSNNATVARLEQVSTENTNTIIYLIKVQATTLLKTYLRKKGLVDHTWKPNPNNILTTQ